MQRDFVWRFKIGDVFVNDSLFDGAGARFVSGKRITDGLAAD